MYSCTCSCCCAVDASKGTCTALHPAAEDCTTHSQVAEAVATAAAAVPEFQPVHKAMQLLPYGQWSGCTLLQR
jgi:hypothetical protein